MIILIAIPNYHYYYTNIFIIFIRIITADSTTSVDTYRYPVHYNFDHCAKDVTNKHKN